MLKHGQFKLLRGVVADRNDDGTLRIRIPGELPAGEGDPEEATDEVDGIACMTAGAVRGGYGAGHRVLVAYYEEQIAPQDRYLVLGVIDDGTDPDPDAHADAGVLRSPKGGAKVICDEDDDGSNPTVQLGSADAARGVSRIADEVTSDATTDPDMWGAGGWLAGFVNVLLTWPVSPTDGGAALKAAMTTFIGANPVPETLTAQITTASDKVFCDDDAGG